jgi:hypothetical protein
MTTTPVLGIDDLVAGQAIPETTVNQNERRIEQGGQYFNVKDKDLAAPPGSPAAGDAYIVAASPTGAWAGQAGKIAYYQAGTGWLFITPRTGFRAYVQDEDADYRYVSGAWGMASTTGGATLDTDGTLAANSDARIATQKAVKTYVDAAVTGLLDFKGTIDCSANPNYPAASKGDAYVVSVAGKIGGASGIDVEAGDFVFARADNAGGTQAAVGSNWDVLQANLTNAATRTRIVNLAITGTALAANEVLGAITPPSGETWTFAANFGGSSGKKVSGGTNPAASYQLDVKKSGTSTGTITISTAGAVSFATSGGTSFSLTGGTDELQVIGPATIDTALGYAFALTATY